MCERQIGRQKEGRTDKHTDGGRQMTIARRTDGDR